MSSLSNRSLPPEIISQIISYVAPSDTRTVALPASNPITRTLHSCLFVSQATVSVAQERLHRHCLYIDSARRIKALLYSYRLGTPAFEHGIGLHRQWKMAASTSMCLTPFDYDEHIDQNLASDIERLFDLLSSHLTRLIYDMPPRLTWANPESNHVAILQRALLSLLNLVEFTSVQHSLSVYRYCKHPMDPKCEFLHPKTESLVWSSWPRLRRLSLFALPRTFDILRDTTDLSSLKKLVVINTADMTSTEQAWAQAIATASMNIDTGLNLALSDPVITVVRAMQGDRSIDIFKAGCSDTVHGALRVKQSSSSTAMMRPPDSVADCMIYVPSEGAYGVSACQEWARKAALDGSIWD